MRSDSHRAFCCLPQSGQNEIIRPGFSALITLIAAFAAGIAIGDSWRPSGIARWSMPVSIEKSSLRPTKSSQIALPIRTVCATPWPLQPCTMYIGTRPSVLRLSVAPFSVKSLTPLQQ